MSSACELQPHYVNVKCKSSHTSFKRICLTEKESPFLLDCYLTKLMKCLFEGGKEGTFSVLLAKRISLSISRKFYGTPNRWREIFSANRDKMSAPESLKPGMELRIK